MNTKDKIKFHTKDLHLVCVNLLPLHYDFLKYLAISRFFLALLHNYYFKSKSFIKAKFFQILQAYL
ncbi:MAG: hypothetical protein KatS3mg129_2612 [Leptospiraceae bacterium]|nr:MAG: hypothetical protein KatS3mg129_2612 [Leptospiraceae bacterium]